MLRADFADVFWPSSSTVARTADDYEAGLQPIRLVGRTNIAIANPWSCLIYLVVSI